MGGKVKLGSNKNRGYCGWHTTWLGDEVFLRSRCEFIYARYLDYNNIPYLMEKMVYTISEKSYKPDFFIYDDNNFSKIIKIVEIKDSKKYDSVYDTYKDYFILLGIDYEIVYKFDKIITLYSLNSEIQNWILNSVSVYDNIPLSGKMNPMYGVKQTTKTKMLISEKAKLRFLDLNYKEKCKQSQAIFWSSERGSIRKKELGELRKQGAINNRVKYEQEHPILLFTCKTCGSIIESRKTLEYCSYTCKRKWKYDNIDIYGKHKNGTTYKRNLIFFINKIKTNFNIDTDTFISNIDYYVSESKKIKLIPKNKGISLNTLIKYNLIEELK